MLLNHISALLLWSEKVIVYLAVIYIHIKICIESVSMSIIKPFKKSCENLPFQSSDHLQNYKITENAGKWSED